MINGSGASVQPSSLREKACTLKSCFVRRGTMYTRRSSLTRSPRLASQPKKAPSRCQGSAVPVGSHALAAAWEPRAVTSAAAIGESIMDGSRGTAGVAALMRLAQLPTRPMAGRLCCGGGAVEEGGAQGVEVGGGSPRVLPPIGLSGVRLRSAARRRRSPNQPTRGGGIHSRAAGTTPKVVEAERHPGSGPHDCPEAGHVGALVLVAREAVDLPVVVTKAGLTVLPVRGTRQVGHSAVLDQQRRRLAARSVAAPAGGERTGGASHADIVRLYAESTVAVVPSLYEGFGLPAVEAMASGIPLVSSDGGALAEVVGDGGLLVSAGDAKALAEAGDVVLSDADVAAELINRGQHRAHRTFSWSVCARQMVEQYQRCIDSC